MLSAMDIIWEFGLIAAGVGITGLGGYLVREGVNGDVSHPIASTVVGIFFVLLGLGVMVGEGIMLRWIPLHA